MTVAASHENRDASVGWLPGVEPEPDADATTAVVAHGLLGNLTVIRAAARMLITQPDLDPSERARLIRMFDAQVDLMQGVLADLVRGLPSQALAALDALSRGR